VASLAAEALQDLPEMTERLLALTLEVEEPYRHIDPDEFRHYARENLRRTLTDLAEGVPISGDAQRETARRRAEDGVPLASVLHAFRIGFSVIWEAMLKRAERFGEDGLRTLLDGAATLWAIIDGHSEVVTNEYRDALVDLARRDQERRTGPDRRSVRGAPGKVAPPPWQPARARASQPGALRGGVGRDATARGRRAGGRRGAPVATRLAFSLAAAG
jgi:hypothetical protein